jgi:hypothetical protein
MEGTMSERDEKREAIRIAMDAGRKGWMWRDVEALPRPLSSMWVITRHHPETVTMATYWPSYIDSPWRVFGQPSLPLLVNGNTVVYWQYVVEPEPPLALPPKTA